MLGVQGIAVLPLGVIWLGVVGFGVRPIQLDVLGFHG